MAKHYLCLPVDLPEDSRTLHLAGLLGCDALPLLVRLFSWSVRQSPDGVIGAYPDAVLASAAGWHGDAAIFGAALRESDWLSPAGVISGWDDLYRVEARRIAATEIKRRQRSRKPQDPVSTGQSSGIPLYSKISDLPDRGSAEGERVRAIPPIADPWTATDAGTFRAYLLAIPGPGPLLALPDPEDPSRNVAESLRMRFPAWDGCEGRPTIEERAQATWDALRGRVQRHTSDPYRALIAWRQWVGDRHDQAAATLRRSGSSTASDLSALASSFGRSLRPVS